MQDLAFVPGEHAPAEPTNSVYEDLLPEVYVPCTVETHEDGTTIVRTYDFWNERMSVHSLGPDGSAFSGSAGLDPSDWSNHSELSLPPSDWGALKWA